MKHFRPTLHELEHYRPFALDSVHFYKNPKQAFQSDHNLQHGLTVFVLSLVMRNYLCKLQQEGNPVPWKMREVDTEALAIASLLHDSQREGDILESMIALQKHSQLAADFLTERQETIVVNLPQKVGFGSPTIAKAVETCLHHDDSYRTPTSPVELYLVSAADRATLPRILISYHDGESLAATTGIRSGVYTLIIETRAEQYEDSEEYPAGFPHLTKQFLTIGAALCLLSTQKLLAEKTLPVMKKFSPERQFDAVKEAALELDLLRA